MKYVLSVLAVAALGGCSVGEGSSVPTQITIHCEMGPTVWQRFTVEGSSSWNSSNPVTALRSYGYGIWVFKPQGKSYKVYATNCVVKYPL